MYKKGGMTEKSANQPTSFPPKKHRGKKCEKDFGYEHFLASSSRSTSQIGTYSSSIQIPFCASLLPQHPHTLASMQRNHRHHRLKGNSEAVQEIL